ncbi:MAG: RAM signaling network component [Lichina confinis]|nr:MAG: RAM signaling network component [Lichina confinis]
MMDRQPSNRLPKRTASGRFPIRVRTNTSMDLDPSSSTTPASSVSASSSSASNSAKSLVSSQRLPIPSIPSRSQHRLETQQNGNVNHTSHDRPRRPGVVPFLVGSERIRSNSEGFVPGVRTKRMGMFPRKTSELSTVNEDRTVRTSHYRGLSHGSVMPGQHVDPGRDLNGGSTPASPVESERPRNHLYGHRLSSVPERRPSSPAAVDKTVDGIMSMLHSFSTVHSHIGTVIGVLGDTSHAARRTTLERVFYNAATHVDELDRELTRITRLCGQRGPIPEHEAETTRQAALVCVMAYQHLAALLSRHVDQIVDQVDKRYVRSLLMFIYSGRVELRNAGVTLFSHNNDDDDDDDDDDHHHHHHHHHHGDDEGVDGDGEKGRYQTEPYPAQPDPMTDSSVTPTQVHADPVWSAPSRANSVSNRWAGTAVAPYGAYPTPATMSNASSRAGSLTSAISSVAASTAAAPFAADSFDLPAPTGMDALPRSDTMAAFDEDPVAAAREERQFERLLSKLGQADDIVLRSLPGLKQQFLRCIEAKQKDDADAELRSIWLALEAKSSVCIRTAEQLKTKMSTISAKDAEARSDRDFWQICGLFVKTFVDLAFLVKDSCSLQFLSTNVVQMMRPMSRAIKEVGTLIETSPWRYLTDVQPRVAPPGPLNTSGPAYSHNGGASASPYISPLPATPLSAALGPAAQATVPTGAGAGAGAGSSSRNGMFSGNVFERADSLLSNPRR